jgi:uncharacterized protein (TIGR03000 family)
VNAPTGNPVSLIRRVRGVCALLLLASLTAALHANTVAQPIAQATARITVTLPENDAELLVNDRPQSGTGASRTFDSPPVAKGSTSRLTITARWQPNTYTTMTRTRVVTLRAGESLNVDLTREDPNDRVRVMYVPTPDDIAVEMVKLAGVTSADVVFEPGCGDARITIAAVKAGARRGVGIDIDPDRVTESRANVKAAGLESRVEIRLGDALDIPDLSDADVVLLYMGDHFNNLIRPKLWKQLKVGARVVSHRFLMGDWKPDKTVNVGGTEGFDYQLHLWTITEDLKRKSAR